MPSSGSIIVATRVRPTLIDAVSPSGRQAYRLEGLALQGRGFHIGTGHLGSHFRCRIHDCRCFPNSQTIDQLLAFMGESIQEGLARILAGANVTVVELTSLDQNETVTHIELVGIALSQSPDADGKSFEISFFNDACEHGSADTSALIVWVNVEVIKKQAIGLWLDHDEPNSLAICFDVPRVLARKTGLKALPGSHWIEPSDALQASRV